MAKVPPENKGALIVRATTDGQVEFQFVVRVADTWSAGVTLAKRPGAPPEGGAVVKLTF